MEGVFYVSYSPGRRRPRNLRRPGAPAHCLELSGGPDPGFPDVLGDFRTFQPHLVLLDIGLPYRNGYHWCEEIRKISKVPILFLSSASDNLNIIMAVNLGGDDFPGQALRPECAPGQGSGSAAPGLRLRRAGACPGVPGAILDPAAAALLYGGRRLSLTKNECRILQTLLEQKGKIVSRETLMQRLWETDSYVDENALTVNVARPAGS